MSLCQKFNTKTTERDFPFPFQNFHFSTEQKTAIKSKFLFHDTASPLIIFTAANQLYCCSGCRISQLIKTKDFQNLGNLPELILTKCVNSE